MFKFVLPILLLYSDSPGWNKRTSAEFETFVCSRFNMEKINIFAH